MKDNRGWRPCGDSQESAGAICANSTDEHGIQRWRSLIRCRPLAVGSRNYFFGGTTASLQAFATRNFTTVFAGILIEAPV